MNASAYVEHAASMADSMVKRETRGPGDIDNAMRRLSVRHGIPRGTFWSLKYRRPKDMLVSVYARLEAAYRAECERQHKMLEHELAITKAKTGIASALVREAARVAGENDSALNGDWHD